MKEKDLYPLIEQFLYANKDCIPDYVGNELSFERFRTDVFGVSTNDEKKMIYLLEGKLYLDGKDALTKVILETTYLESYADYVYIFGKSKDNFEEWNKPSIDECKSKGIGILIIDDNNMVHEFLKPKKRLINNLNRKETLFRIFNKRFKSNDQKTFITDFILQSAYEYTLKTNEKCAEFIDIYEALFSNNDYRTILRKILGKEHLLNEIGMRQAFEKEYSKSSFIRIEYRDERIEDLICVNEKILEKIKPPILLDNNK